MEKQVIQRKVVINKGATYQLITALLLEKKKKAWRMDNGLALAYTPAGEDGGYRFVVSLRGRYLSKQEIRVVQKCLFQAMSQVGMYTDPLRPPEATYEWSGGLMTGSGCVVWTWRLLGKAEGRGQKGVGTRD